MPPLDLVSATDIDLLSHSTKDLQHAGVPSIQHKCRSACRRHEAIERASLDAIEGVEETHDEAGVSCSACLLLIKDNAVHGAMLQATPLGRGLAIL